MAAQKAEPDENPKSIEKAIREGDCREAVLLATAKAARLLDSTESARDARPLYSCIMEGWTVSRRLMQRAGRSMRARAPEYSGWS